VGDVMQVKVPEAVKHSWEYELHKLEAKDRIVFMTEAMREYLGEEFGHRAIGCVSINTNILGIMFQVRFHIAIMPSFI
jgi:hypothetical protein